MLTEQVPEQLELIQRMEGQHQRMSELLDAVQRWADDDLRSLNGQIEFLLRKSLIQAGRKAARSDKNDKKDQSNNDIQ